MTSRYQLTRNSFVTFVKDLDKNLIETQPKGFNNTIHWHIGHVLVSVEGLLFGFPKQSTTIPEFYNGLFATGTKPADWTGEIPTLNELVNQLEQQLTRINRFSDEQLAAEIPFTLPFGNFKTYGDLYDFCIHHEAEHLGQIKAMKRIVEAN